MDLLPAHGLRPPAPAAGHRPGRDVRRDRAAGRGGRRRVEPRDRPGGGQPRGRDRGAARVAVPARAAVGPRRRAALPALLGLGPRRRSGGARRAPGPGPRVRPPRRPGGVGFVTLAATFARYIDRADQIVTVTIYPAICAIRGRTAALAELFVRSNRATLLWTLPAAAGIVLFAGDLVDHVLGRAWDRRVGLIQGLAVAAALQQLGFNWFSFYRAHGDSRPGAVEAVVGAVAFLALAVPGLLAAGFDRVRRRALRRRCSSSSACARATSARCCRRSGRATCSPAPSCRPLLGVGAVVALRLALWLVRRRRAAALAEVALFAAVVVARALRLERDLLARARRRPRGRGALAAPRRSPARRTATAVSAGISQSQSTPACSAQARTAAAGPAARTRSERDRPPRRGDDPGERTAASSARPTRPSSAAVSSRASARPARARRSCARAATRRRSRPRPMPSSGWSAATSQRDAPSSASGCCPRARQPRADAPPKAASREGPPRSARTAAA